MEQQLHRYFLGIVGFAFVVTWVTLGATAAVAAAIVCVAGANLHRLLPLIGGTEIRSPQRRRPARTKLSTRPLHSHELVPDDPSLIIST